MTSSADPRSTRLSLVAGSAALTLLVAWAAVHLYARSLGIRDPWFRYENRMEMWARDPDAGFANKPGFDDYCFGTVRARTDERGFRIGKDGTSPNGTGPRIVGIGDSVMWGASVNQDDSLLGVLASRLGANAEVINAGVVGYATLQEAKLLAARILPMKPEIVLINYCTNDLLPTEDPFRNVRDLYVTHLLGIAAEAEENRGGIEELIRLFDSRNVWEAVEQAPAPVRSVALELLVERPMVDITEMSVAAGARPIWLFIPPRVPEPGYEETIVRLQQLVGAAGGESLDLSSALRNDPQQLPSASSGPGSPTTWRFRRDLDNILLLRRIERAQTESLFIDNVHPSRRGNIIIANAIHDYLSDAREPDQPRR